MTRYTPTELREMADQYDLCAEDYGYRASISEALRQAADDADDTERYRWLRAQSAIDKEAKFWVTTMRTHNGRSYEHELDDKDMDAAIDAARKETT